MMREAHAKKNKIIDKIGRNICEQSSVDRTIPPSITVGNFNQIDTAAGIYNGGNLDDKNRSASYGNLDEQASGSTDGSNLSNNNSHYYSSLAKIKTNVKKGFEKLFSHGGHHSGNQEPSSSYIPLSNLTANAKVPKKHLSNKSLVSMSGDESLGEDNNNNNNNNNLNNHPYSYSTQISNFNVASNHMLTTNKNQKFNHSTSMPEPDGQLIVTRIPPLPPPRSINNYSTTSESNNNTSNMSNSNGIGTGSSLYTTPVITDAAGAANERIFATPPRRVQYAKDNPYFIELKKKLIFLSPDDRLLLQQKGYDLILQEVDAKRAEIVCLKDDIKELNEILLHKNEPIKSNFEIEALRKDIRCLTNEKAQLELMISAKKGWNCKKCTYLNENNQASACLMCTAEREDEIFVICNHCQSKNSLIDISCNKCNAYFDADNQPNTSNNHLHHQQRPSQLRSTSSNFDHSNNQIMTDPDHSASSSTISNNSPVFTNQNSPNSMVPNAQYYMSYSNQQPSIPYLPPVKSSSLTNNFASIQLNPVIPTSLPLQAQYQPQSNHLSSPTQNTMSRRNSPNQPSPSPSNSSSSNVNYD